MGEMADIHRVTQDVDNLIKEMGGKSNLGINRNN